MYIHRFFARRQFYLASLDFLVCRNQYDRKFRGGSSVQEGTPKHSAKEERSDGDLQPAEAARITDSTALSSRISGGSRAS
jgi:hypothetical protein